MRICKKKKRKKKKVFHCHEHVLKSQCKISSLVFIFNNIFKIQFLNAFGMKLAVSWQFEWIIWSVVQQAIRFSPQDPAVVKCYTLITQFVWMTVRKKGTRRPIKGFMNIKTHSQSSGESFRSFWDSSERLLFLLESFRTALSGLITCRNVSVTSLTCLHKASSSHGDTEINNEWQVSAETLIFP